MSAAAEPGPDVDNATTGEFERPLEAAMEAPPSALRRRWEDIQLAFVDDPQRAVAGADALVQEALESVTRDLDARRSALEASWQAGERADTEDLRTTVQAYRALLHRLLEIVPG